MQRHQAAWIIRRVKRGEYSKGESSTKSFRSFWKIREALAIGLHETEWIFLIATRGLALVVFVLSLDSIRRVWLLWNPINDSQIIKTDAAFLTQRRDQRRPCHPSRRPSSLKVDSHWSTSSQVGCLTIVSLALGYIGIFTFDFACRWICLALLSKQVRTCSRVILD